MKLSVIHVISSFEDTGKVNGVAGMQSSQRDLARILFISLLIVQ